MNVKNLNPYNFVRCSTSVDRKELAPAGHSSFNGFSGMLRCRLTALTHIFIPSNDPPAYELLPSGRKHKKLLFFSHEGGLWTVPASSLRGPVRSVAEAVSNSCFSVFDGEYPGYKNEPPVKYELPESLRACPRGNGFCPTCRLFGIAGADDTDETEQQKSLRSKVRFMTATYIEGPGENGEITLAELSLPKPYHSLYYGEMGEAVAKRKFYYHHWSHGIITAKKEFRNVTVKPLKPGAIFDFDIWCHNLDDGDLSLLVYSLELERDDHPQPIMAHKIGIGKPVGLGSVGIKIIEAFKFDPLLRYKQWSATVGAQKEALICMKDDELQTLRQMKSIHSQRQDSTMVDLRAILRCPSDLDDDVGYPEWHPKREKSEYRFPLPEPGKEKKR